jgi:predicted KAP-like P-loop ATPase
MTNSDESSHIFSADRPIECAAQDLLNRREYASRIAKAIADWQGQESLIIGVSGPWGSGKTSFKNLILECLDKKSTDSQSLRMEFNPWQWSATNSLTGAFLDELSRVVLGDDSGHRMKATAKWLRIYSKRLALVDVVTGGLTKAAKEILSVAGVLMIVLPLFSGWINYKVIAVGVMLLAATKIVGFSQRLIEKSADWLEAEITANEKTLPQIKGEIASLMLKATRAPFLVIIDDVDRLEPHQIREVFKLIKSNADFPNFIYLVLFQKDTVKASLEEGGMGADYLQKIVQVDMNIPRLERKRLDLLLQEELSRILEGRRQQLFDQQRWANLYVGGLRTYFRTLRDVKRIVSSFEFYITLFESEDALNVNPIDLFALEVLRHGEPDIYSGLPERKSVLTGQFRDSIFVTPENEDEFTSDLRGLLQRAQQGNSESALMEVLADLFPSVADAFGSVSRGNGLRDEWSRTLRCGHPEYFDRYFQFALSMGEVPQFVIQKILENAGEKEVLALIFDELADQGLLSEVMTKLDDFKEHVSITNGADFISALFDASERLPSEDGHIAVIDPPMHVARIVYWYLLQESDVARRFEILSEALGDSASVYLPVKTVFLEAERHSKGQEVSRCLVAKEHLESLKQMAIKKIKLSAESDNLLRNARLAYLLWRWRDWEGADAPSLWLQSKAKQVANTPAILKGFSYRVEKQELLHAVPQIEWRVEVKSLNEFSVLATVEEAIDGIDLSKVPADVCMLFKQFNKDVLKFRSGEDDFP